MLRLIAILFSAALLIDQTPASSSRSIAVISDLHMGPGRDAADNWHPYEDFRWRDEFIAFLNALNAQGGDIDLVINGDLFELLQSQATTCGDGGCTVLQAIQRLEAAVKAHADELIAIGRFAAARGNRVYVVPGDHDAALLIVDVWQRLLPAFAAPEGRISLVTTSHWTSSDGRVHVEHGHQLPLSADRFSKWPNPWVMVEGRTYIDRPWGEQVILPFYNVNEARFPIVDNIAEEGVGVKFVAARADAKPPTNAAAMLRFLLTKMTWQQFRMDLDDGEVQPPVWDLARIRAGPGAFMAASLPSDDPFAPVMKTSPPEALAGAGSQLTDQDIVAICDYRAAIRRARRRMERVLTQLSGVGAPMSECPRTPDTVGSAFEYYWRSRDRQVRDHIRDPKDLDAIVFGHTHLLDRPYRPFGEEGPVVVTSGAWQRTIHPNDLEQIDAPLESLPACYSFVQIGSAAGRRTPQQRSWRLTGQQWGMANGGC
jgi:UDP-2,3-diacylglucosamine pyrophosphatase LpxH